MSSSRPIRQKRRQSGRHDSDRRREDDTNGKKMIRKHDLSVVLVFVVLNGGLGERDPQVRRLGQSAGKGGNGRLVVIARERAHR